ncbi:hypothetical protein KAR48_13650 [bacterium]|nr:hypothetical protein [bacterium]
MAALTWLCTACYDGHGLEPGTDNLSTPGITGIISFEGSWPDSTREVRVAALRHFPHGLSENTELINFMTTAFLTGDLVFSDTLALFRNQVEYSLDLAPGEYKWIVVAWFPELDDYLQGVKELGAYTNTSDETDEPQSITVRDGQRITGININANLIHINRDRPFFEWPGDAE